jgi:sugar/nucleoside kinase (ribokinase family)
MIHGLARPDLLAVGHVTKDLLTDGGYSIGGTATYASLAALRLGASVAVFTSAPGDLDLSQALGGVAVHRVASPSATTFENIYLGPHRKQYIHGTARPLHPDDLPEAWRRSPIVLLCPIAGELGLDWMGTFRQSIVGVTPQGWMRRWDESGLISHQAWREAEQILPRVDVLVFSNEDVGGDQELVQHYARLARIAAVTEGPLGVTVYWNGQSRRFPAYRAAAEIDPTGAGDVFAAAFLLRLKETQDPNLAAPFANCAASFAIEGPGTTTLATRSQVEARMARGELISS